MNTFLTSFLTSLLTSLSGLLLKTLNAVIGSLVEMFKYLNGKRKDKIEKEAAKKQEALEKDINNIVDKGSLEDLIDIGDHIK